MTDHPDIRREPTRARRYPIHNREPALVDLRVGARRCCSVGVDGRVASHRCRRGWFALTADISDGTR